MITTTLMLMVKLIMMMSEKRYIDDVEALDERDLPCVVLLHRFEEKMWAMRLMRHS